MSHQKAPPPSSQSLMNVACHSADVFFCHVPSQHQQVLGRPNGIHQNIEATVFREGKFEYLDHTADVQLHSWCVSCSYLFLFFESLLPRLFWSDNDPSLMSWLRQTEFTTWIHTSFDFENTITIINITRGESLQEAFEQSVVAMFHYITDLNTVEECSEEAITLEVAGHDVISLLFNFLDECLFQFSAEGFCMRRVEISTFDLEVRFSKSTNPPSPLLHYYI